MTSQGHDVGRDSRDGAMSRGSSGVVTAVEQIVVVKVAGGRNRDQKGQKAQVEVHVFCGDPNVTFWVEGNNGRDLWWVSFYWGKRVAWNKKRATMLKWECG